MPGFHVSPEHAAVNRPMPSDPVYTYVWDIQTLVGEDGLSGELVYLKDCTLPSPDFETASVKTGHTQYEFASQIRWDDIRLTFYDTGELSPKLYGMFSKAWNFVRGVRPADDYMFESRIRVYYYNNVLAYYWVLRNSWIKSIKWTKLTYESSDINQADVTLKYTTAQLQHR